MGGLSEWFNSSGIHFYGDHSVIGSTADCESVGTGSSPVVLPRLDDFRPFKTASKCPCKGLPSVCPSGQEAVCKTVYKSSILFTDFEAAVTQLARVLGFCSDFKMQKTVI